ncbi:di-trans,poly-cis-decaprenylcistransferase [Patescibacteria group bacterium]|nr:di-trans,poly-cis-decaprenylcistransferase [Patescibacteria group bacterium]MBU1074643.1 di-trans,poly-cis-decaprenylcistransferase [Patescibacteria group bacterium]MBU1952254.1 di-trans,poly-cis-decaprenylcistransferase [Patescibacteria group bacterium]
MPKTPTKTEEKEQIVPKHIGIIMDGNRTWARKRGLPTFAGHKKGYDIAMKVGGWCLDRGVNILTIYAFSTENWNRSKNEVSYLMHLLKKAFTDEIDNLHAKGIQVRVIGIEKGLSKDIKDAIKKAMQLTKNNKRGILNIALNYGGRSEITEAVKKIVEKKLKPSQITEKLISNNIFTADLPDPDLIIRTSGEQRLSGFLTWQSAYSELMFIKKTWPAFTEKDVDKAINEFSRRNRRFGGN